MQNASQIAESFLAGKQLTLNSQLALAYHLTRFSGYAATATLKAIAAGKLTAIMPSQIVSVASAVSNLERLEGAILNAENNHAVNDTATYALLGYGVQLARGFKQ